MTVLLDSSGGCERTGGFPVPVVPGAAASVSLRMEGLGQEAMGRN